MILELLGTLLAGSAASLLIYLLVVAASNRQKYRFFAKNAPGLKVMENPSLFGGHINQIVHVKDNVIRLEKLLEIFGPTFGFYYGTKPAVVTTDLELIKIFLVDEQNHVNRVEPLLPIKEVQEDCIMFAEDAQWLKIRKAIAPAFSAHKIKLTNVEAGISKVIDRLIDHLERRFEKAKRDSGGHEDSIEVDVEYLCHRYSLSLVFSLFYKQDNVVEWQSEHDKMTDLIDKNLRDVIGFWTKLCAAFPILQTPLNWMTLNFHNTGVMRNTIMDYIKQQTKLHFEAMKQRQQGAGLDETSDLTMEDGTKFKRNMIDYIIDQYREGKLTRTEFLNTTFFLFFAADKTTADTLSRLLHNLAFSQEIQAKLRESILLSGVNSEYLSWCIYETLRLHPPAPIGGSREIKRDIQTKHGLVPAGTFVATATYAIHRLKEYWGEDANEFRPERWANSANFHPVQFLAFGGGRRVCPGRELALMGIKSLMNVILHKFRLDRPTINTDDNSKLFTSPLYISLYFDFPTYVRFSRLDKDELADSI